MRRILFWLFLFSISLYAQRAKQIDPISTQSLYLLIMHDDSVLATATGFIVAYKESNYLITNRHVVTGFDPWANKQVTAEIPNNLIIRMHGKILGNFVLRRERLYDSSSGKRRWKEHPMGMKIDVVALPVGPYDQEVHIYPFDLNLANTNMVPMVSMPASIVGFPLGNSGPSNFPIWKTGHIASDPDLDFQDLPIFMIDATTRPGMSGSPVVLRASNFEDTLGNQIQMIGLATRFLGIYAAQNSSDEIGFVYKPIVIRQILDQ